MIWLVALIAPLTEETLKAFPLFFIFIVFRREFDGLMDGLIYGALVGFGFAMTENFIYILGAGVAKGLEAGLAVFFMRTIAFGMMHALWSSMFGVGLGLARYARSKLWAWCAPCGGLFLGMLMHGAHNFSAVMAIPDNGAATPWMAVMITSYFLGCVTWLFILLIAGRGEARMIRAELVEEVETGLLTPEQAKACGRYRSRVVIRWRAFREKGVGECRKLGRLYCLSADLAFKKHQHQVQPTEKRNVEEISRLRSEIQSLRATLEA